jgi:hypothetical protein
VVIARNVSGTQKNRFSWLPHGMFQELREIINVNTYRAHGKNTSDNANSITAYKFFQVFCCDSKIYINSLFIYLLIKSSKASYKVRTNKETNKANTYGLHTKEDKASQPVLFRQ